VIRNFVRNLVIRNLVPAPIQLGQRIRMLIGSPDPDPGRPKGKNEEISYLLNVL
jgi:hypothetical protein